MRIGVCVLLVLTTSCRCGTQVTPTSGDLVVEPLALDFGTRFVGTHSTLAVSVRNESRASRHAAVQVDQPFSLEQNDLTLGGGDSANVVVHFDPATVGPVTGTLRLTPDDATPIVVTVTATAAPIPDCPSAAVCHERHFSLELGACTDSALADGTSCNDACLTAGRCVSGECRGAVPERCDDHDLCTVDACSPSDGACVHAARECPVVDPCTAAFCDPTSGCASMPVTDGTPCGEATCRLARICLNGTCQTRPKPGADDECTAVDLVASSDSTCMLTRAGSVRCWGEGYANGYQNFISGLTTLPFSGPVRSFTKANATCASVSGRLECFSRGAVWAVDAGAGHHVVSAKNNDTGLCALLSTGALWCSFGFTPSPFDLFDGGIRAFAANESSVCAVRDDGGVACTTPLTPLDPAEVVVDAPASAVRSGYGLSCATHSDGVSCWTAQLSPRRLPTGLSDVAIGYDAPVPSRSFLGLQPDGGVKTCQLLVDGGFVCAAAFDGGFPPVRRAAIGFAHECFLVEGGEVACRGSNRAAQLGDLTRAPPGAHRVGVSDAVLLTLSSPTAAIVQRDGGVMKWGNGAPFAQQLALSGAQAVELLLVNDLTCVLRRDGRLACQNGSTLFSPNLPLVSRFVDTEINRVLVAVDGGTCFFSADGTTACWAAESPMQLAGADGTVCRLARDGGVTCDGSNFNGRLGTGDAVQIHRPVDIASGPVRKVAMSQWQGCALERAGTVRCWGTDPTTFAISPPTPLSGLLPLARDLVCGNQHCCVLVGDNAVSCWGSNSLNQLGREGVSKARVPVPMPDRVEQLAASGDTTCARLRSGEVWCWGDNQDAQLGLTPLLRSEEPVWVTR